MDSVLAVDELRTALQLTVSQIKSKKKIAPLYSGIVRSDCPYGGRHLRESFAKRPWWRTFTTWEEVEEENRYGLAPENIVMTIDEYEVVDWAKVLQAPNIVTNNYCVRKGLSRKANFAKSMLRHAERCGPLCPLQAAIPATACIDTVPVFINRSRLVDLKSAMVDALLDADELMEASSAQSDADNKWIMKPSLANKGAEVFIVSNIDEVEGHLKEWRDVGQWVLQKYVPNPLLLDNRKFHLRVYVLANGALRGYVFQEALILVAVEPYSHDHTKLHAHITNTCVNVGHDGFDETRFVRCTSELEGILTSTHMADAPSARKRVEKLWDDINDCVHHAFAAFEGAFGSYMPLPNAFELYGVDFLVSDDWQVHLLEFNPTPDIKQTGSRLDYLISAMVDGMVAECVDTRFPPPPGAASPTVPTGSLTWKKVYDKEWQASKGTVNIKFD